MRGSGFSFSLSKHVPSFVLRLKISRLNSSDVDHASHQHFIQIKLFVVNPMRILRRSPAANGLVPEPEPRSCSEYDAARELPSLTTRDRMYPFQIQCHCTHLCRLLLDGIPLDRTGKLSKCWYYPKDSGQFKLHHSTRNRTIQRPRVLGYRSLSIDVVRPGTPAICHTWQDMRRRDRLAMAQK